MSIQVTDRAVAEIRKGVAKLDAPAKGLRVGIRAGGCTGFSYLFEWATEDPRADDHVLTFEDGAVRVFIDPRSYRLLDGSTLTFNAGLVGRGFVWENPNVKGKCGCGASVSF